MDGTAYSIMQQLEDADEAVDDDLHLMHVSAAVLITGAEASRQLRNENRKPNRNYLCRPQLPPNPRENTAWTALFNSRSNRAYITTMGFDVATFELIVRSGFGVRWFSEPIPRADTSRRGEPRPGARSLDAWGALGLVLHYLNSTMLEISLQQIFGLIPTTVSRYITFGMKILLHTLREMPDAAIHWPRTIADFQENSNLIVARHPRLDGAFGSIDGLNLPTQTSGDDDIENATYNGWLSEHFVSSVIAFSPHGLIIDVNTNAPGSWHDSRVARPIYTRLLEETPDGFYLVADSAFPRGTDDIKGRIVAPIKSRQTFWGTREEIEERFAFDRELLSYRQTAEWGMRDIQGSFGRLRLPLPIDDADFRGDLLETCFRLANLRTRRVGRNEIKKVYEPEWKKTAEEREIWENFENMLFGDQRRHDRVSRFHIHPEYQ